MADQPKISDRGFIGFDEIRDGQGAGVRVFESSAALSARIWVKTSQVGEAFAAEVALHLLLEDAARLRDQLTYLIDNHHMAEPRDDSNRPVLLVLADGDALTRQPFTVCAACGGGPLYASLVRTLCLACGDAGRADGSLGTADTPPTEESQR